MKIMKKEKNGVSDSLNLTDEKDKKEDVDLLSIVDQAASMQEEELKKASKEKTKKGKSTKKAKEAEAQLEALQFSTQVCGSLLAMISSRIPDGYAKWRLTDQEIQLGAPLVAGVVNKYTPDFLSKFGEEVQLAIFLSTYIIARTEVRKPDKKHKAGFVDQK